MDKNSSTELLFEMSVPGRRSHFLPACDVPVPEVKELLPASDRRLVGDQDEQKPRGFQFRERGSDTVEQPHVGGSENGAVVGNEDAVAVEEHGAARQNTFGSDSHHSAARSSSG